MTSPSSTPGPARAGFALRFRDSAGRRLFALWIAALAGQIACGAATASSAPIPSYRVVPGDVLGIMIYAGGEKQDDLVSPVSAAGVITCPLVGDLHVAGLTPPEIAVALRDRLASDYFVEPQVLVTVREYVGKIYINGEVKRPGVYSIQDRLTVLNACILAGGFTDFASPGRVRLTRVRDGVIRVIKIDLTKVTSGRAEDRALETGDRIDVPARRF